LLYQHEQIAAVDQKRTACHPTAKTVPVGWDAAELCRIGRFDRMVRNVFLPERRTMMHSGGPPDHQRERWPVSYALSIECRFSGPHHSAVITGIDALIHLAGKTRRGRERACCA
jgi:indole-3-acetate monooxygenase